MHHLVKLTRKDIPWEWGEEQERAMEDLQEAVIKLPALKPLDYKLESPVEMPEVSPIAMVEAAARIA